MRIFFLTNLLSPYRVEWLNQLSAENEISAYYLFTDEATREKQWLDSVRPVFSCEQVKTSGVIKKLPSREFLEGILSADYDIHIIDGYSSPFKLKVIDTLIKKKKKVLINIDGIDIWRKRSRADLIKDRIKRRVFRSGAYFLCGSKLAAGKVVEEGADEKKVFVHPFTSLHDKDIISYEQKRVLQNENKKKLGKEHRKIVLAVGRFIPLKRYDCLIEAWQDMPDDAFLYLIGGGEERDHYEQLISQFGIKNIALLDFMLPEKLGGYFTAADLFVHPSSTETWGLVINEAMAKGCPVIATDRCVGAVELIRNGKEGYLTGVGDTADLQKRMRELLSDDALLDSMSHNVLERILPYTYENLAQTHMKIFEKVLKER